MDGCAYFREPWEVKIAPIRGIEPRATARIAWKAVMLAVTPYRIEVCVRRALHVHLPFLLPKLRAMYLEANPLRCIHSTSIVSYFCVATTLNSQPKVLRHETPSGLIYHSSTTLLIKPTFSNRTQHPDDSINIHPLGFYSLYGDELSVEKSSHKSYVAYLPPISDRSSVYLEVLGIFLSIDSLS